MNCANDLMTGNYRQPGEFKITFNNMKVGVTNTASMDADEDF
jgi:hypothetical protein